MDWARIFIVFSKELVDHLRDRRALFSAAFGVFVGPGLITLMLTQLAEDHTKAENISIPVAGSEYAPDLIKWLGQQAGVAIEEAGEDAESKVRDGDLEIALVIDKDYRKDFSQAKPAEVKVIYDGSENTVRDKAERVKTLVNGYSRTMGSLRLIARGVAPDSVSPIDLRNVEVSSAQRRAARILGFLPMLVLLAAFAAGMGPASDSTAGERERGSLEALLVSPAPSEAIVAGKWVAAAVFAGAGSLISLGLCAVAVRLIPLQELGLRFRMEDWQLLSAALIALPAAIFAPALQMLVCSFSRTLKEAQSYLGMLVLLPMAPGMLAIVFNMDDSLWMNAVPFFAQTKQLGGVLGGDAPAIWEVVVGALVTLAAAGVCVAIIARQFRSEKIVLSR